MRRWEIRLAPFNGPCYICCVGIRRNERIAWHPDTKQFMHEGCFRSRFHVSNVSTAQDFTNEKVMSRETAFFLKKTKILLALL